MQKNSDKMPVVFVGHGSPMNAINNNDFVKNFKLLGKSFDKPRAILCVSAHWETRGTFVTAMKRPRTIHDFSGFPQDLYDVQYPAPGSLQLATRVKDIVIGSVIQLDNDWGLDHGTWSVVRHMYPNADVPVVQLSLDYTISMQHHIDLARELCVLRDEGVLIVGSGNMVHNLDLITWEKFSDMEYAHEWAKEANEKMKEYIIGGKIQDLVNVRSEGRSFEFAIPTLEHFLPLIYAIVASDAGGVEIFNDRIVGGAISMTSIKFS